MSEVASLKLDTKELNAEIIKNAIRNGNFETFLENIDPMILSNQNVIIEALAQLFTAINSLGRASTNKELTTIDPEESRAMAEAATTLSNQYIHALTLLSKKTGLNTQALYTLMKKYLQK